MRLFSRPEKSILLVCTANICRSPMAEGVLRAELLQRGLEKKVRVDSAGTHASQPGRAPDPRALQICEQHGIHIARARARQVTEADFDRFDHILAMDRRNLAWLLEHSPPSQRYKLAQVTQAAGESDPVDIPDPYYGNLQGFVEVFSMLRTALDAFVARQLEV